MRFVHISNAQSKLYFGRDDWDLGIARKVMDYIKANKCGKFWKNGKEAVWFVDNQHILAIKGIEDEILNANSKEQEEGLFGEEEFMRQFDE